jgi:uracil-DNA glycosylase
MRPLEFVQRLQRTKFENVFNPYSDRCELHDRDDAPLRRCNAMLALLLAAIETDVDSLWLGRDLGFRGGRRTGLALTDDVRIAAHAARWDIRVDRATVGPLVAERTAAVVWRTIEQVPKSIFLWNVFPFHPYDPQDPFTNRAHNRSERTTGEELLSELITLISPRRLVALGKDAAAAALRLAGTREVAVVRHPSYGGQREFATQIAELYGLRTSPPEPA